MQHFRDFDKQVKFVMNLVSILKVTDLTQENVSCLNTSLVSSIKLCYSLLEDFSETPGKTVFTLSLKSFKIDKHYF